MNQAIIDTPKVLPGPNGSIDLHWDYPEYEMLINIPTDNTEASFYGDNRTGNSIKGKLDKNTTQLLLWLIRKGKK